MDRLGFILLACFFGNVGLVLLDHAPAQPTRAQFGEVCASYALSTAECDFLFPLRRVGNSDAEYALVAGFKMGQASGERLARGMAPTWSAP